VLASPKTIATGENSTIVVTVRSGSGALLPGVGVTLSSTGSGNTITPANGGTTNANGVATFTLRSTVGENKTVSATAGGVLLNDTEVIQVFRRSSTVEITGQSAATTAPGESFTVRFSVSVNGGGTPTGTVTIFSLLEQDPNGGCSDVPVSAGSCTMVLTEPGTHHLQATYSGDSQFEDSSDDVGIQHTVQ
jgi:hypothetical protein